DLIADADVVAELDAAFLEHAFERRRDRRALEVEPRGREIGLRGREIGLRFGNLQLRNELLTLEAHRRLVLLAPKLDQRLRALDHRLAVADVEPRDAFAFGHLRAALGPELDDASFRLGLDLDHAARLG